MSLTDTKGRGNRFAHLATGSSSDSFGHNFLDHGTNQNSKSKISVESPTRKNVPKKMKLNDNEVMQFKFTVEIPTNLTKSSSTGIRKENT